MRGWLFDDLVSVVAPRPRGRPGWVPTRRSARWLIGIGVFVTFFGVVGVTEQTQMVLERQPATVTDKYTSRIRTSSGSSDIPKVRLRLEDGDTKDVPSAPVYEAIGDRDDVQVMVDINPDTNLIDAIYLDERRYGTGRQSAVVVVTILIAALGVWLLLRGIGRWRRVRVYARTAGAR